MNIANTKTTAAGAQAGANHVVRSMGRCALLFAAFMTCAPAMAQQEQELRQRLEQRQLAAERSQARSEDPQDTRRFEQRAFADRAQERRALRAQQVEQARQAEQAQQDQRSEALQRSGRMTADERRNLRRQINEAGIDLYPNTPRR